MAALWVSPEGERGIRGYDRAIDQRLQPKMGEGVGDDPGTVEVIDLDAMKTVATADVPTQAAGIDFWKTEPSKQ